MRNRVKLTNYPGLDLDGTLIPYNLHDTQDGAYIPDSLRFNQSVIKMLPVSCKVAIITNQGGLAFYDPEKPDLYPSIETFVRRLNFAIENLENHGYQVADIRVSLYHMHANPVKLDTLAQKLRDILPNLEGRHRVIYTCPLARKPETRMLRNAYVTAYYGDHASDQMAAMRAGIPFVHVPRFT